MIARFIKMHGCGNDFVVIDERHQPFGLSAARIAAICDRRTGIGCDQLITIEAGTRGADALMRIRNSDGSEAGACGNATRCVAHLIAAESNREFLVIRTISGDLPAAVLSDGRVRVDMGFARLGWADIPLSAPMDTLHLNLARDAVSDPAAANLGNPHATFFVPDLAAVDIARIGPSLEHDPIFPDKANIGFAQVIAADRMRLRVWERGAGLTLACGSGACAALVNAHRRGLTARCAAVLVDGGELEIEWGEDDHVMMTGPVATSFRGEVDLAEYPS